jgi:hypothetical protein
MLVNQSCETMAWVEHKDTQVVQTSWATMALMYAKYPYPEPLEKAVKLVMGRQLPVSLLFLFRVLFMCLYRLLSGWFLGTRSY